MAHHSERRVHDDCVDSLALVDLEFEIVAALLVVVL